MYIQDAFIYKTHFKLDEMKWKRPPSSIAPDNAIISSISGGLTAGNESELLTESNLDTYIQDYNVVDISSQKELADFCNNVADILDNSDDWEKRIVAVSLQQFCW